MLRAQAAQSPGVHPGKTGDWVHHVQGDCQEHLEAKPQTDMSSAGEKREQQKDRQRGEMQMKCQAERWVCSSAKDQICRNGISSAQARKRRQPQS